MGADAPRVGIRTLGCKVNRSEAEALAESLTALGVALVADESDADAIVVNTCAVTGEAGSKGRKEVRRALRATSGPVVVTGCLAAIEAECLRGLGERVHVRTDHSCLAQEIAALLEAAAAEQPPSGGRVRTVSASIRADAPFRNRTRALVKVQDGCSNRCSYCIVPDARGVPRSVPTVEVLEHMRARQADGAAEVVLTGVNIGRYCDPEGACDLAGLVELIAATGIPRIRVSSIEPPDLDDRMLEVLARTPSVANHLHVPLQSGCDRTLAAMGRR